MKIKYNLKHSFSNSFSNSFLRFVLIGSTLFSNKLILIIIAYFFSEVQYNLFNKAYYTASILILFGTLGFDFVINRINVSLKSTFFAVLLNISISISILYFFSEPFENPLQSVSILIYSLFAAVGGIFTFQHLFQGRIKIYVILMFTNTVIHLLIIPFITLIGIDIYIILPIISLTWFLIGLPGFMVFNKTAENNLIDLYKLGVSTFIINSAVSLALVVDKYIVNHYFPIDIANAYTFSWGLIVPLLYMGNVIEKLIYSSSSKNEIGIVKKSMLVLFILVSAYSVILFSLVNLFPSALPASIDAFKVAQIFGFMIIGYALFVIINFPVNGYLFKFVETIKQKKIALAYLVTLIIFPVLIVLFYSEIELTAYKSLLMVIWLYIFLLLIIKTAVAFFPMRVSYDAK